jgi:thioredoxin reductase (NADPH)
MAEKDNVYDLIIIGGGPAGLFALFQAGMRELRAKLIESLTHLGGQVATLYPEKTIHDIPGIPKIQALDLVENMEQQARQFGGDIGLGEHVEKLERDGDIWHVSTDKDVYHCRAVIVATGVGAFTPRRLGIPEIEKYEENGVYYFMPEKSKLAGRNVVVVGGGDSAIDWALELQAGVAKSVALVHRREGFRAHEESVKKLFNSGARILLWHEVKGRCDHPDNELHCVIVFDNRTKEETVLPCDVLLMGLGFSADAGPLQHWNLDLDGNRIKVDMRMATNLPGIFAVGDVAIYPGKVKRIAPGVAEAAAAVNHAKVYLDPTADLEAGYSSTSPKFKK